MSRASRTLTVVAAILASGLAPVARAQERPVLELSLEDAVKRALENNVDIAVEKSNPEASQEAVHQAQGVYDPLFSGTLSKGSQDTPASSVFSGGDKVTTDTTIFNFGLTQAVPTGASVRLDFTNSKQDTNNVFSTFNPSYNSTLGLRLTQPLLRNFSIDQPRQQLRVAKKSKEISDLQFRQTVLNILANVRNQYYDLLYAIDNLDAQRKSLTLAQKLLSENQIKVKVGTLAPLDVVSAQAEVASRESGVILAEGALSDAEDQMKRSIFPRNDPATWAVRIVPTDRASADPVSVDGDAALKKALESRTDVVSARKSLESADITAQLARNQVLPALDLVASYGTTGVGGTEIERSGLGGPIVSTTPGSYGDATSKVFGRDFPSWTLGVNFTYPILNRQARASSARARIARDQAEASLRRLELQVATEVRSATRSVETNLKRVASTRAARVLAEQRLDAEEKKFAAGMSTNFLVTQAQRDLALAEVADLQAIGDYRKSLVAFERVQEAGLSGGSSSISVAFSSASASSASSATTSTASR